jgi:radical SAM protein with 4Fe4S-binding SPASM domain
MNVGDLMRELEQAGPAPVQGTFELTARCNLKCGMCYIRVGDDAHGCRQSELSAAAWRGLANDAVKNGLLFVLLTGGEIFLRRDFFDIYEPLTQIGVELTLYTNGTLITDAVAKRLSSAPPSLVEITLYGASVSTYERVTGVRGSYARCRAGIEALMRSNINVGLKATVTRDNAHELSEMNRIASALGVPFTADWMLVRRRDGRSSLDSCRITPSECVQLEGAQLERQESRGDSAAARPERDDRNFYCNAGRSGFVISPSGDMNICLDLAEPAARPVERGFAQAWHQIRRYVEAAPGLGEACGNCGVRDYCVRCPASSFLESRTLTEPVPYLCELARLRSEAVRGPSA